MPNSGRREAPFLFIGDIGFLIFALWATLFIRYGTVPEKEVLIQHLVPFSLLFALSTLVFFIAGLYEKHTLFFKSQLPETILYAQGANIVVAAVFFFLVPVFGIQPKTNLFIYLVLSTLFVSLWRMYLVPFLSVRSRASAFLVGAGEDLTRIFEEVNGNSRYDISFVGLCNTSVTDRARAREEILSAIEKKTASVIVVPFSYFEDPDFLPEWGELMFRGTRFIDAASLYEDLFDRVSLSLLSRRWFLEERARTKRMLYSFFKRVMDIIVSVLALVLLSPLMAFIALILKFGEGGAALIFQTRVGRGGRDIRIVKFRTMLFDDGGDAERQKENRMTAFGKFLRVTQLDELPQFWNVLAGDLSLIGPRPEVPLLTREYERSIPFYNTRHMIEPGISGWAQIKHVSPPKFRLDVEATRSKLSYDLYYLKHRSLLLDIAIALQTIKILLARSSR